MRRLRAAQAGRCAIAAKAARIGATRHGSLAMRAVAINSRGIIMSTIDLRGATVSATDPPIGTNPNPDLAIKAPVRVATTGSNVTLSALQTVDGVTLAVGDRVLVKDQSDATTNGLYNAATGPWTRTIDAANNSQFAQGLQIEVASGAANANSSFVLTTADPITVGTSALAFQVLKGNVVGAASAAAGDVAVYADTTGKALKDTSAINVNSSGQVGINMVASGKQMQVRVGATANSQNSVQVIGYQASFEVINQAANQNYYFAVDDSDGAKLKIGAGYSPGQGLVPFIASNAGGYLSINTASVTTAQRLLIEDGTGAHILVGRYPGKGGFVLDQTSAGAVQLTNVDNSTFALASNNIVALTIQPSAGIGVGTSSDPGTGSLGVVGAVRAGWNTGTTPGGNAGFGFFLGSATVGIYWGSGPPSISAVQGSLYLRTDGSSTSTRLYVNTNGSTGWTNVTTAA
jgi:hypothetical protein